MSNQKWVNCAVVLMIGFVATSAFAEGAEAIRGDLSEKVKAALAIASGFGIAIASLAGAFGQAKAIATAVDGIARNPEAAGKIFAPTLILGLVLIESLVIYALVVSMGLAGKI